MGLTIGSNRREVICSVGWDWDYSFLSLDEEGYPISHSSQSLTMDVIDEKGAVIFTMSTDNGRVGLGDTTNQIVLTVPYSVVKDVPPGVYFGDLVQVVTPDSRKLVAGFTFRHGEATTE